uniref:Major facilitator superfamily (MFS) profile domain-containing protein n=1 Tax=Romanomermis culicivorax TaxID=13658 RepID=A0A915JHP9_ROMCU
MDNFTAKLCYFFSFIYWSIFAMQMMISPYISEDLTLSPLEFTILQTVFFACQMIGALYYGQLCKFYGLKMSLILAFVSQFLTNFISFLSVGFYSTLAAKIAASLAQVPVGLQTIISSKTEPQNRAQKLGQLGATIGLGFAAGSLFCGVSSTFFGPYKTCLIGGLLSLSLVPVVSKFIDDEPLESTATADSNFWSDYCRLLKNRSILMLSIVRFSAAFGSQLFLSIFGIYVVGKFRTTPLANGALMVYGGVLGMLLGVYLLPHLHKFYSREYVLLAGLLCLALFGLGVVLVGRFFHFYIVWPLLSAGFTLAGSSFDSLATELVEKCDHGNSLSLAWFIESAVRVVTPMLADLTLNLFGFKSFGFIMFLTSCTGIFVARYGKKLIFDEKVQ